MLHPWKQYKASDAFIYSYHILLYGNLYKASEAFIYIYHFLLYGNLYKATEAFIYIPIFYYTVIYTKLQRPLYTFPYSIIR